ncbi:type I polyketide synthase [Actinomadura madurae]|uniref:type I polyketide synthase n=1 Tax=Actinomadura madurae TaxID=1993 RepID=UPI0020D25E6D|nr:type I polyketide synthase [Actinomadura madurae]MCQ0021056.1 type I polyketide synthase [Actinomadura madurae]
MSRPEFVPDPDTAVAVTGLACRFPGAPDAEAFWTMLVEGREGLVRCTDEELAERGVPRRLRRDPAYVPVAGLIDGQDMFDPKPFGLAAAEAALLDPQHRLFLECAWRALEQAGHGGGAGAGSVGVFAGAAQSAYLASNLADRWDATGGGADPAGSLQTAIATQTDYMPLQTAYRLNLTGPAVAVNTTCSTSLVAVHLAGQSLLNGECDTALAGGVSLIVPQGRGYLAMADGIYSRDGKVRPFSANGSGVVYSQGAGVVVLRRLRDALDDGDPILAVVAGSAVNNDGAAKAGFTAPSLHGQAAAIAEAHAVAGVGPRQVGYVEAHGTATRIGDPIEVGALRRVFGDTGPAWCGLGSVKSNIGHANSAAGIASFIKTVLAMRAGTLPASLHADPVNELLGLDGSPFEVLTETRPWDGPRLAGVSSFGIGGTNAHVVVGPAPGRPPSVPDPRPQAIVLSAHDPVALRETAADLAAWTERQDPTATADLAHTLQTGRDHLPYRLAVAATGDALASALRAAAPVAPLPARPRVIFAFPGGGSARPGMGAEPYADEPVFTACADECAELFADLLKVDIRPVIRGEVIDTARVHGAIHGLPALFAVSLATARLLESWGVGAHAVLGHSLGEYTAAVVSGALSLEDAARPHRGAVHRARGGGRGRCDAGRPAARAGHADSARPPSGRRPRGGQRPHRLRGLRAAHRRGGAGGRAAGRRSAAARLRFDGAAHSRLVEPALPDMRHAATRIRASTPAVPLISTVTGTAVGTELGEAEHWVRQLRQTVLFSQALRTTVETVGGTADRPAVLVQVGPGAALATLARGHDLPGLHAALPALAADTADSDLAAVRDAAGGCGRTAWTSTSPPCTLPAAAACPLRDTRSSGAVCGSIRPSVRPSTSMGSRRTKPNHSTSRYGTRRSRSIRSCVSTAAGSWPVTTKVRWRNSAGLSAVMRSRSRRWTTPRPATGPGPSCWRTPADRKRWPSRSSPMRGWPGRRGRRRAARPAAARHAVGAARGERRSPRSRRGGVARAAPRSRAGASRAALAHPGPGRRGQPRRRRHGRARRGAFRGSGAFRGRGRRPRRQPMDPRCPIVAPLVGRPAVPGRAHRVDHRRSRRRGPDRGGAPRPPGAPGRRHLQECAAEGR